MVVLAWAACSGALSGPWVMHKVRAESEVSGCANDPWVELAFEGASWPSALQANATEDLRAGLRLRGIGLCADGQGEAGAAPVARAVLQAESTERFDVTIEIQDAVTEKRVSRKVDLRRIAPDARALVLAQAVDELLRASWIELTLPNAPEPVRPPPPAVRKLIEVRQTREAPPPAAAAPRTNMFGARVASELYQGGFELFGPDAQMAVWLDDRLALSLTLGVRMNPTIHSSHGSIEANAWVAGGALRLAVWPRTERFNLLGSVGAQLAAIRLTGHSGGGAGLTEARTRHGLGIAAQLGVSAVWQLAQLVHLELELGPGLALSSVTATDTERDVVTTRGLHGHGALSVGGVF